MAINESISIRRNAAIDRIEESASVITSALSLDELQPLRRRHKNTYMHHAQHMEAIADLLEAIAAKQSARKPKPTKAKNNG